MTFSSNWVILQKNIKNKFIETLQPSMYSEKFPKNNKNVSPHFDMQTRVGSHNMFGFFLKHFFVGKMIGTKFIVPSWADWSLLLSVYVIRSTDKNEIHSCYKLLVWCCSWILNSYMLFFFPIWKLKGVKN